jgi:hypothetical protein
MPESTQKLTRRSQPNTPLRDLDDDGIPALVISVQERNQRVLCEAFHRRPPAGDQ